MTKPDDIRTQLLEIVEPVCEDAGYELVDVRYVHEQGGWIVRVFIDHPDGITFDDCERMSRELSPVLDVEDPIPHGYNLEVSSPGVDRPLRTAEHFRRFTGHTARVTLAQGVNGRRRFKGTILAVEGGEGEEEAKVVVEIDDGQRFRLPVADVSTAKLVPDWSAVTPGGAGGGGGRARNAPAMGV